MLHDLPTREKRNDVVNTTKAVLTVIVAVGLACSATAQVNEQPGEVVELNSLPASVQETIKQKAAGGEVVQVKREETPMENGIMRLSFERTEKSRALRSTQTANS